MKLKFNFNKRNRYKNICSIEGCSDIADESEEYIQNLFATDNYKDLEYIRKDNEFYFYLKTYSNG